MATLYELSEEYQKAFANVTVNDDGELEGLEELEAIKGDFNEKAESIALFIKNLTSDAEAINAEAKKQAERAKALSNKADRLKKYLGDTMQFLAIYKISTPKTALSFRKSVATEIFDEFALPEMYFKVKTEKTPDKTAIKDALKEGKEIPGAKLVENMSLQVK